MSEYGEHFIREIKIKNYKLFKDFEAKGFGRVNLIGGKNNVGKTAFMEACYLGKKMLPEKNASSYKIKELNAALTIVAFHRYPLDYMLDKKISIHINSNTTIKINNIKYIDPYEGYTFRHVENYILNNTSYISSIDSFNKQLVNNIFEIKLLNREDELNEILSIVFNIEKIDVIRNTVMYKNGNKYSMLQELGDGVKHFLNIILALYLNKDNVLYLDEIENGIHYTNLDKLWEIILTISKEQNVQVFATTHSKECIESYARVAKKLEDEEVTFLSLYKNREEELKSITFNYEKIQERIELGLDNR